MRKVISRVDFVGYRHQLDRVCRMLARIYRPPASERDFHDDVFSFFMHCHHLADWVDGDPIAPSKSKRRVRQALAQSSALNICRDLACGSKHLRLDKPKSGAGARYSHSEMTELPDASGFTYDIVFDDGRGNQISGLTLAFQCVAEWRSILQAAGLTVRPLDWAVISRRRKGLAR